jgi:hypothetical protein
MSEENKRGRGRPRLEETMTPQWYDIIVSAGKEGKHITDFLITLGISWEGHHRLLRTNSKYSEAVQEYTKLCEQWWYNKAYESMEKNGGQGFNSRLWSLIVRNKFSERWSESTKVDVTSQGDKLQSDNKIQVEIIKKNIEENQ